MSSLDFDFERRIADDAALVDRCVPDDGDADTLERRWFAAMAAVESLRDDCRVRLRTISAAEQAWRRDSAQLAQMEAVRDALANKLAALQGTAER
jgi:hypothetical protein